MTTHAGTETRGFQAEVKQLLKLMIHSLYSHREIFLRELISNASDACDKLRFSSLADPALLADAGQLEIRIDFDSKARTITVTDTGLGMTRDEAVEHLGTIAKSGTAEFFSRLTGDAQKDSQLIGQFGVGFYSSFIVADRVEVRSRKAGQPAATGVRWTSEGAGEFTVEDIERAERGTSVVLHLKEDAAEFADAFRLRQLVRRYSDHIAFPVLLRPDGGQGEYDRANQAQALWTRQKQDLSDDEYREFYRHVSHDPGEPLAWSHHRVEGRREYTALLYVPSAAPFDLYNRDAPRGLKLYVRRVFILDDAEQFLPLYLRFVKGVVDSGDLPLNVSRELLQQDREVEAIRGAITRRVLDLLAQLAENEPDKYRKFWKEFGAVLKEGLAEDDEWMVGYLGEYEGKPLKDAAKGALGLEALVPEGERKAAQLTASALEPLWQRIAGRLGDRVAGVRASERLTDSPSCLVREEHDLGPQLRRLLEAAGQSLPPSRAWLELNPSHPLVRRLDALADGDEFDDVATLLHEQAVLAEGGQLSDPAAFVRRINRLIGAASAPRIVTPGAD
ncbi:MAG: heat shock protein 90 [Proteobacteria bacterium]|nr:heat shock protein 90 [Pseudomonadota bacterium]